MSHCYNFPSQSSGFSTQALPPLETILPLSKLPLPKVSSGSEFSSSSSFAIKSPTISPTSVPLKSPNNNSQAMFCSSFLRRPRGEKRPIPEEQKDEKYFERRKRNNEAAKKSRDARKMREDRVRNKLKIRLKIETFKNLSQQIALRAAILEQENSILRAQTIALREEVCTLRQILCNSRALTSPAIVSVSQA